MDKKKIDFREVREEDWTQIDWLASDEVQEADHSELAYQWSANRRSFQGDRIHSVAVQEDQVVGYCGLERTADEPDNSYRMFLVTEWNPENQAVQEALFEQLLGKINETKTEYVWMRELVGDVALVNFVKSKGFIISSEYESDNLEIVNLHRTFPFKP